MKTKIIIKLHTFLVDVVILSYICLQLDKCPGELTWSVLTSINSHFDFHDFEKTYIWNCYLFLEFSVHSLAYLWRHFINSVATRMFYGCCNIKPANPRISATRICHHHYKAYLLFWIIIFFTWIAHLLPVSTAIQF